MKGTLIKMEKETLEEAAERLYPTTIDSYTDNGLDLSEGERLILKAGAKWQAEKMFDLVEEYNKMLVDNNVHEDHKELSFKEWFEQFKKN